MFSRKIFLILSQSAQNRKIFPRMSLTKVRFRTIIRKLTKKWGGRMREKRAFEGLWAYNDAIKTNTELYRGLARSYGLAESAFWVLYALRMTRGGTTLHELCASLCLSKQTVHSAIKQLQADGVLRAETAADRRSRTITLTERGAALAGATVDRVIDAEVRAVMDMSESELAEFLRLFRRYNQALKREFGENHENPSV